jgi:hypothetical protein
MRYFLWLLLYVYGLLYHITSSEFWPVTISKTWFTPEAFEYSMLQKPLLSLFLALFHLLPLNDVIHVFLVKTVFAIFGITALTYFFHFVIELTQYKSARISQGNLAALLAFLLVCVSPLIRTNYFNIRSDQVAFLFFSLFLLYAGRKQFWPSLVCLVLIPCFGIKEFIFLIPGFAFFIWTFRGMLTLRILFFAALASMTILIWVAALNMNGAFYLLQTYGSADYSLRFSKTGLFSELALAAFGLLSILYILTKKLRAYYPACLLSVCSFTLILCLPQAFPFFLASLLPIALLPFFVLLYLPTLRFPIKTFAVILVLGWSAGYFIFNRLPWHVPNLKQLWFIEMASKIVSQNKFTYLDGQGILPRQKFVPCFVSPDDDLANNSCLERIKIEKPDALIITNRLAYLGQEVFDNAESVYTQVYPNFWILRSKMNEEIQSKIDLTGSKPIPIITF